MRALRAPRKKRFLFVIQVRDIKEANFVCFLFLCFPINRFSVLGIIFSGNGGGGIQIAKRERFVPERYPPWFCFQVRYGFFRSEGEDLYRIAPTFYYIIGRDFCQVFFIKNFFIFLSQNAWQTYTKVIQWSQKQRKGKGDNNDREAEID